MEPGSTLPLRPALPRLALLREANAAGGEPGVSAPPFFKARLEAGRYGGFFEAHIEQGPDLEAKGLTIGVWHRGSVALSLCTAARPLSRRPPDSLA